jgi:hypothetical protein
MAWARHAMCESALKGKVQVSDDGINESHKPVESASNQAALKQKQSMEGVK